MLKPYLMIGEVLKPQGIRGEAKLRLWAADEERFTHWDTLYLKDGETYTPIGVHGARLRDGFAYCTFDGCTRPEDVEKLRGRELWVDRAHAAPPAEGEVYVTDLIGCEAVDGEGRVIGTLTDVLSHGPVDVYVFRTPKGEMMAPALKTVFTCLDVENGRILTDADRLAEVAVFED